jgi:uncharacterized protein DUF6167
MSRITWFAAGAATGVYGIVRAKRAARNLTPDGLAARAAAVGAGLRVFTSAVSTGMAEREGQLRQQLALPPGGRADAVPPTMDAASDRAIEPTAASRDHEQNDPREGVRVGHR